MPSYKKLLVDGDNVSKLNNDAGYITSVGSVSYNDLTDKPTLFDGNYNSLSNKPSIPTHTSHLTNNSGYITSLASIPATTLTGNMSLGTSNVTNKITLGSASWYNWYRLNKYWTEFSNNQNEGFKFISGGIEAYIQFQINNRNQSGGNGVNSVTAYGSIYMNQNKKVATEEYVNSRGFLTSQTDSQQLSISSTTLSISGGNSVTLPIFDGQYSSLSGRPTIPTDYGDHSKQGYATQTWVQNQKYLTSETDSQTLSISGSTLSISGGNNVSLPTYSTFSGSYNDLSNKPSLFDGNYNSLSNKPTIPTNNNQLTNGAGYVTSSGTVTRAYRADWVDVYDTRSTVISPYNGGNHVRFDFKGNSADGLNDGGAYHGIMHFQQWSDSSGGKSHQIGFTDNNNIYARINSNNSTWGSWSRLAHASEIPSLSGYATQSWVNSQGFLKSQTDSQTLSISGKSLSISNGNSVTLPFFDGNYNSLSNKPTIPSLSGYATQSWVNSQGFRTTDADTQDLSISGRTISLTNGGSVTVPASFNGTNNTTGSADRLNKVSDYSWSASTIPRNTPTGVTTSFVRSTDGFPQYGSVLNVKTYTSSDGGVGQIYFPYDSNYGGDAMRYRLGKYSGGWTDWKTVADRTWVESKNYITDAQVTHQSLSGYATESWVNSQGFLKSQTDSQTLSISGKTLTISSGNSITLPTDTNATTLSGLSVHTGTNNHANKIVRTQANGYIHAGWINTTSGDAGTNTITRITASYDGYLRYYTPTNFGKQIGQYIDYSSLQNKPTIPTNNNQLTNGAGYITSYVNTTYSASTGLSLSGTAFSVDSTIWRDGNKPNISEIPNNTGYITAYNNEFYAFPYSDYGSHWANDSTNSKSNNHPMAIKLWDVYNDRSAGAPDDYGTILDIYGRTGHQRNQLFMGNTGYIWSRSTFYNQSGWNSWNKLWSTQNLEDSVVQSLRTNYNKWLTSHQSLSGYATQSWVNSQGFLKSQTDSQTLSVSGKSLSISGGNSVTLPFFDGNYNSLSNKPSIPSLSGYATQSWVNSQGFGTSSFSGSYNDLSNKPTIPTNTNQLTNGAGFITGLSYNSLSSKPTHVVNGMLSGRSTHTPDTAGDSLGVSFHYAGTPAGIPGTDHSLMTMAYSHAWQTQMAQDWRNAGRMYIRGQLNGTWSSWFQQWSEHDFSQTSINNWQTAYGWGDHAGLYLGATAKASDSHKLDGLAIHSGTNNQANRIVRTDANGYINAGWINTTSGSTNATITRIYASYDGYIRYYTPAEFGKQIGGHISYGELTNKPTIPTNNNQLTNGAGYLTSHQSISHKANLSGATFTGDIRVSTHNNYSWLKGHSGGLEVQSSSSGYGGIVNTDVNGGLNFQLYGSGGVRYGFLSTEWGAWDFRKEVGGRIYTNNQTTYYLQPETTSVVKTLEVATSLVTSGSITFRGSQGIYTSGQSDSISINPDAYLYLGTSGTDRTYIGASTRPVTIDCVATFNQSTSGISYSDLSNKPTIPTNNNQLTNGAGYVTTDTNTTYTAGTGMSLSGTTFNCTVVNTDTNTTYSAGTGVSLSGTTFSIGQAVATNSDVVFKNTQANGTLTVNGVSTLKANTSINADLTVTGTITYGKLQSARSDERLKKDIQPLETPLDKVSKLEGKKFKWKDDDAKDFGVIAQEVEKVLPELVSEHNDGYKGVNYQAIIPYLIESIKELKNEVETLKCKCKTGECCNG